MSCAHLVSPRTIRYTWVGVENCPAVRSVHAASAHRVEVRFADVRNHCLDGPAGTTSMLLTVPRPVAAPVVIDVRYDGHPKATYTAAVAAR